MTKLMARPIASGANAELYGWQEGEILKLFRRRGKRARRLEVAAIRAARGKGLRAPRVINDQIEIDRRYGMSLQRIEGETLAEHLVRDESSASDWGSRMAELHAEMHAQDVFSDPEIQSCGFMLAQSVAVAAQLSVPERARTLWILRRLPAGRSLCHGDFSPRNIILGPDGPVIIDWARGSRGHPLADFAGTWISSRVWPVRYEEQSAAIREFWQTYLTRYQELSGFSEKQLASWLVVAGAARIGNAQRNCAADVRSALADFVRSMLAHRTHHWVTR